MKTVFNRDLFILILLMRKVGVVPHNREWQNLFEAESRLINRVLSPNVVAIHRIGNTAISSIYAKPIINLLVAVKEINY
ncbi:MAG: GrpB family protein [Cyanobacteria bacterium P01_G01_bin.19]